MNRANNDKIIGQVCARCIYDQSVGGILFDENGVCRYCRQVDQLTCEYQTGMEGGRSKFEKIIAEVKRDGRGKQYDCVIGVSGGTDSSYMIHQAVKSWGLRPLAVHYDNTWNTAISTQNIHKVLTALDVDLYTHVVDNKEADDIFRAFFYASVSELEASTDLALAEVLYRAAWKHRVKYVFEGHSFITEGITPVAKNYFDGRYIKQIHKRHGRLPMKTYPLMDLKRFLFWTTIARIKKIRPYWYLDYNKEDARAFLSSTYDWQYYGGHHLENRMTAYFHTVYAPQKLKMDFRNNTLSARVRNGQLSRDVAIETYCKAEKVDHRLVKYFCKRLGLSENEYMYQMNAPLKFWTDFPTYKKTFERLRPMFFVLSEANLVPKSFYYKYCFPTES